MISKKKSIFWYQKIIFWYQKIIFWCQKIVFWYQKFIFDIRKSIFWYKKNISFSDIKNHFLISEIQFLISENIFWYQKTIIFWYQKMIFWYQKVIFWYQKIQNKFPFARYFRVPIYSARVWGKYIMLPWFHVLAQGLPGKWPPPRWWPGLVVSVTNSISFVKELLESAGDAPPSHEILVECEVVLTKCLADLAHISSDGELPGWTSWSGQRDADERSESSRFASSSAILRRASRAIWITSSAIRMTSLNLARIEGEGALCICVYLSQALAECIGTLWKAKWEFIQCFFI